MTDRTTRRPRAAGGRTRRESVPEDRAAAPVPLDLPVLVRRLTESSDRLRAMALAGKLPIRFAMDCREAVAALDALASGLRSIRSTAADDPLVRENPQAFAPHALRHVVRQVDAVLGREGTP